VLAAVTVLHPIYRLHRVVKVITAAASAGTFRMPILLAPTLISGPSS
jgi:hypothetical protein